MFVFLAAITSLCVYGALVDARPSSCPCADPSLCQRIQAPPRKEVFIFRAASNDNWKKYDWSIITTVAEFAQYDPDLMCHAHSLGVRYVLASGYPKADLSNATSRTAWVRTKLNLAITQYMDGINIDFESILFETEAHLLISLVNETAQEFRKDNSQTQITFDAPFGPGCTLWRCYDYKHLAELCDFLVLMDYDINGPLFAAGNDAFESLKLGVQAFIADGIPADKLVTAVPWYGVDWKCKFFLQNSICVLFSTTSKSEIAYSGITQMMKNMSIPGGTFNETVYSKFFSYKDPSTDQYHQVWYDDPETLTPRFQYAKDNQLRGVGVWEADELYYGNDPEGQQLTKAMWDAVAQFISDDLKL